MESPNSVQDVTENGPIESLPREVLGMILRWLRVRERIRCEAVSRRWKETVLDHGWTEQKRLDREAFTVERDQLQIIIRFNVNDVTMLLSRVGENLRELDLDSITQNQAFQLQSLALVSRIEKLRIKNYGLQNFVHFLPPTLTEIRFAKCTEESLNLLIVQCPNLSFISIQQIEEDISIQAINNFVSQYPELKTLVLGFARDVPLNGTLTAIEGLHQLDTLCLGNTRTAFTDGTLHAVIQRCPKLRNFQYYGGMHLVSDNALLELATLRNLEVLGLSPQSQNDYFVKNVIPTIAQRGKLKAFSCTGNYFIMDCTVKYLLDHCKSLTELDVSGCELISNDTVRYVLEKLQRRYGDPPRTLPTSRFDERIFYLDYHRAGMEAHGIDNVGYLSWAAEVGAVGFPWLVINNHYHEHRRNPPFGFFR